HVSGSAGSTEGRSARVPAGVHTCREADGRLANGLIERHADAPFLLVPVDPRADPEVRVEPGHLSIRLESCFAIARNPRWGGCRIESRDATTSTLDAGSRIGDRSVRTVRVRVIGNGDGPIAHGGWSTRVDGRLD